MPQDPLNVVLEYHERTKHHFDRSARSLGYLDWATQPDPFRRFDGAPQVPLDEPPLLPQPTYDALFQPGSVAVQPVNRHTISRLFYHALALSAWKQAPGTPRWSLRINPSSGALYPTEGYLIAGPIEGLNSAAAVSHYSPYQHVLEQRVVLPSEEWQSLADQLPADAVLIGLTSIYWRESWKYGERAFRYCNHDVGHAIGAVAFAAASLGWSTRLIDSVGDDSLALLLGVDRQQGIEAEHPDCLLAVFPVPEEPPATIALRWPASLMPRLQAAEFAGTPNRLSHSHQPWPVIDEVSKASRYTVVADPPPASSRRTDCQSVLDERSLRPAALGSASPLDRQLAAEQIIRQRRSAVDMDGQTAIDREVFYGMLARLTPATASASEPPHALRSLPFAALPWPPHVSLALFVHRVQRLTPGVYVLVRDPRHEALLRGSLGTEFLWQRPEGCPAGVPLWLLQEADCRRAARAISCHQDIAADGVFSLGMLAEFEPVLRGAGPWFYRRLFWETGLIGQVLYLEAEAAGIRGTGIGCFFDDAMHDVLGIHDRRWQSLYHFTVGGPVVDQRLQTISRSAL
jgi:SagB-type dehydrogenase family enzyme